MKLKDLKLPEASLEARFVLQYGVHIATRSTLFCTVALLQLDDYYVEVFYNKKGEVAKMSSFRSTDLLAPYLSQIDISRLFQ